MNTVERFFTWYWLIYFAIYLILVGVLTWLSWRELIAGDSQLQTLTNVYGASAGTASIAAIVLEGLGKMSLLIFGSAAKKLMEEVRREGREKGREEEREKWMAWELRRREAQARNESFDEPPP
jgi:hypothetical protein